MITTFIDRSQIEKDMTELKTTLAHAAKYRILQNSFFYFLIELYVNWKLRRASTKWVKQ